MLWCRATRCSDATQIDVCRYDDSNELRTGFCWNGEERQGISERRDESDNSEIRLGELAAQKGGSEDVRSFSFGQALVDDHRKAKDEATALAGDLMTVDAQNAVEKLQRA